MVQSMRSRLPHIELHMPQVLCRLGERARATREWVGGFFSSQAPHTPSLNHKFLEQIQVKNFPITRKERVVAIVTVIAGIALALYTGGVFLAATTLAEKTVSLAGYVGGIGMMIGSIGYLVIRGGSQRERRLSSLQENMEERLFKEYSALSNAGIAHKFKEAIGKQIGEIYSQDQIKTMIKDTKASSVERALLPALIRYVALQHEYKELSNQHRPYVEEHHVFHEQHPFIQYEGPIVNNQYLDRYDMGAFRQNENSYLQKLYTKKFEVAFALAVLRYPDRFQQTSLDQLGTICDYTANVSLWIRRSELPFFFGKKLSPTQGIESVRYKDMGDKSIDDLAQLLVTQRAIGDTEPDKPYNPEDADDESSTISEPRRSPRYSPRTSPGLDNEISEISSRSESRSSIRS